VDKFTITKQKRGEEQRTTGTNGNRIGHRLHKSTEDSMAFGVRDAEKRDRIKRRTLWKKTLMEWEYMNGE